MNISDLLKQIGLNQKEVDIFMICSKGFLRASEIAGIVKLKRTNIYTILDSLIKKGLIVELKSGKVKKFRAVSISRLYDYVERQKLKLDNDTKRLDIVLDNINKQFSIKRHADVEFFNGMEEVSKFVLEKPKSPGRELVKKITKFERYAMVGDIIDKANSRCENIYQRLKSKYVSEMTIVPDNEKSRDIITYQTSKYPSYQKFHDFRFVDFKSIPFDSQIIITGYDVSIVSITEAETWAVKFMDKSMFNSFKAIFSALWSQGKPLKK